MTEESRYPEGYLESKLWKTYPDIYKAVFINHRNILLSSPGGCGKSFTIGMIKEESLRIGIKCVLTSTTGVSAHSIKGETIHRFSGIKLADKPLEVILKSIKTKKDRVKAWKDVQILVIDEVSMLNAKVLELIEQVATNIRFSKRDMKAFKETNTPIPLFGGVQTIYSADFLQLPPIEGDFVFESLVWKKLDLVMFRLTHPFRYPDIDHFNMLSRIRVGEQTAEDIKNLKDRIKAYEQYRIEEKNNTNPNIIKPTRIYSLKKDVGDINLLELEKLEGDTYSYNANDVIIIKKSNEGKLVISAYEINTDEYVQYMDNIAPPELLIKINAQVMLTSNLDVENGLVNGSRGIVNECHDERISVKFRSGTVVDIIPQGYEYEDDKVQVVRYQFPLILAWANTFHKNQGITLDYAILDLGTSLFGPGMGYVGLSRCRTLQGILLVNIIPEKIKPHNKALAYEKELVNNSIHLKPVEIKEQKESNESPGVM
jgi:ATP-dependent DNA helicase PIF1